MEVDLNLKDRSTFWKLFYEDFSKHIFKPYMEEKLAEFGKKVSMYYVDDDNYSLDFDLDGLDFGCVSLINGAFHQLKIDSGILGMNTVTRFHGTCLLRITLKQ